MYAACDHDLEILLKESLRLLLFVDEREIENKRIEEELRSRGMHTEWGMKGAFYRRFEGIDSFFDEIASAVAQFACRLGYIRVTRKLSDSEWPEIRFGLRRRCKDTDFRLADIESEFGEASFKTAGSHSGVHAYAGPSVEDGWVFLDFDNEWRA